MNAIHNFARLILFVLRRDRIYLSLWVIGLVVLGVFFVPMLPEMVGDEASRRALEETMRNPAMVAMCGIVPGVSGDAGTAAAAIAANSSNVANSGELGGYTLGAMFTQFILVWAAMGFAIFNILFVVRHTRKNEEEGRLELFCALPVGHNAILLATLIVAVVANLLMALLISLIIPAFGIETLDFTGALSFGFLLAACGLVFAGIAAIIAQVANTSRGAMGLTLIVFGVCYLLRAAGDIALGMPEEIMALISPLGLIERSGAFVLNEAWPVAMLALMALVLAIAAFALSSVRDSGAGMLPSRKGRVRATMLLRGEWSLAWRQTRGMLIAWAIVVFSFSAAYGAVFGDMQTFIENNELYRMMMQVQSASQSDFLDPVVAMLTMIMTLIAAVPVVFVILRLRTEEKRGRLEQVLAKAVSRVYMFLGYIVIACVSAVVMQALIALGLWCTAQTSVGDILSLETCMKTAFNYLPGLLLFVGIAALLVGVLPRLSNLVWVYLVFSFFVAYLGSMLNMPKWTENLSPFSVLPRYPVEEVDPLLICLLLVVTAALSAVGVVGYRKRDLG
ncbi:MAG: hypothetical protein LBG97_03500 [Coriobacteriales bacterium]|jgi:ABC-2 type transport system permease protein|nr:hypothetical protein [Coriobacteriales bacterium]